MASNRKAGFHGHKVTLRSGAAQAALGAATYAAPAAITYVAPSAVPADSAAPDSPTTAEFNAALAALSSSRTALVATAADLASVRTQLIAAAADVAAHKTLLNEIRAALVEKGIVTGAV